MEGYCNSPIIIESRGFTPGNGAYFPQLVLRINGNKKDDLTAECGSGKSIRFNLADYAQGQLYNMTVSPTSSVPQTTFSWQILERQFLGGSTEDTPRSESGSISAYLGRGDVLDLPASGHSYKPTDTEVVAISTTKNRHYVVARGQEGPVTALVTADTPGVYAEINPLRHQIIFLNSFGRWESASALTRESKKYNYSSEHKELDRMFPDNVDRAPSITNRQLEDVTWQMTSGYCTPRWAAWWAQEVMAAQYAWLVDGSRMIPIVLVPSDSNTFEKISNGEMCSIDFAVRFI